MRKVLVIYNLKAPLSSIRNMLLFPQDLAPCIPFIKRAVGCRAS
jgi:hypothetical protein